MEQSTNENPQNSGQTIIINENKKPTNGIGTAGFVLALIALFIGWVPFLGWITWLLGLVFSFIGVFKSPKGLSIAGLIVSFIGIIFLILVFGAIGIAAMAS